MGVRHLNSILSFTPVAISIMLSNQTADAALTMAWRVGIDNGNNSDFGSESGNSNAAPGQAAFKDDDFYRAGTYAPPIGTLAKTDLFSTFERALTIGDPTNRIHFNLAPTQTNDNFTVQIDHVQSNFGAGSVPMQILFNGVQVDNYVLAADGLRTTATFNGSAVGAVTGDNVISLQRGNTGGAWTQFDFVQLNFESVGEPDFAQIWQLGIDNNTNSEFGQESGGSNAAPGQSTVKDDDYYFAGTYPAPVGTVAGNEANANFERALTNGDRVNRVHFNLTADQLDDNFMLDFDLVASSFTGGAIPLFVDFNGIRIYEEDITFDGFRRTKVFSAADVGALLGENIITFSRGAGGNWTQFDFIRLNGQAIVIPEPATMALMGFGSVLVLPRRRRSA